MASGTIYDFHSHTFLSDGCLSPVELVRRAVVNGYRTIAVTDHVGLGNCDEVLRQAIVDCELCARFWDIQVIPGVEITHVPAESIAEVARHAREAGAKIVVVHGETLVEPVEPGTNLAAVSCPDVDVLAHPGHLTAEEAQIAAAHGVFVEVSARGGHGLGNGNTVLTARAAGARLIVDSDSHEPGDLLTEHFARRVAIGAGVREDELREVLADNPERLLKRIAERGAWRRA